MPLSITHVSVNLEVSDKSYGDGEAREMSLRGCYFDSLPLEKVDLVILDSLDMFLAAWKSVLSAKFSQGGMTGEDYKNGMESAIRRTEKAKAYLKKESERPAGPTVQPQGEAGA